MYRKRIIFSQNRTELFARQKYKELHSVQFSINSLTGTLNIRTVWKMCEFIQWSNKMALTMRTVVVPVFPVENAAGNFAGAAFGV